MLQFMINNKGALSIFTLFVLIPVMLFSGILIDFARIKAVQAQAASAAETYANSYLSVYDELLNEVYGLFAVTQSDDGMKALEDLKEYMQAAYTPNSVDKTHLTNANALGLQDAIKRVMNGSKSDYSDALQLTGNAFSSWDTEASKPLVEENDVGKNYNTLQMQISEYVKFIGPTELLANTKIADMLKPDSAGSLDTEKNKNEVEQINKNYQRIKGKNEIDKKIGELNEQINNFYNAMAEYDETFSNYFNDDKYGVITYVSNEQESYKNALEAVEDAYDDFKSVFEEIQEAEEVSFSNKNKLKRILKQSSGGYPSSLNDIGECFDGSIKSGNISDGNAVNYNKFKDYMYDTYIEPDSDSSVFQYSYSDVCEAREHLINLAGSFSRSLNDIKEEINDLIKEVENDLNSIEDEKEKESTQKFIDGLKNDYSAILGMDINGNDDQKKMWIVANFNYGSFSSDFNTYAQDAESKIISEFKAIFENGIYGVKNYDDYLRSMYNDISGFIDALTDPDVILDSEVSRIYSWLERNERDVIRDVDDVKNGLHDGFSSFYKTFEKNDMKDSGGISYKELYDALKTWNDIPDGGEEEKKKAEKLEKNLWDAIDKAEFNNTKLRSNLENKMMPSGSDEADKNTEKTKLKDILDKEDSGLGQPDSGTVFTNKLLLMLYDYGMFTCQTSDKKISDSNGSEKVEDSQPFSYQGIALAKKNDDGKYEDSETNFLLYGELEYLFQGNADPEKNFNAVRNSLAVIRFVPNYISTYTIDEINSIINGIQSALSWCPLAAIAVAQALRIAIASFETWCDLDLLYGGYSVLLYKNSFGDLSFIAKLKDVDGGNEILSTFNDYSGGKINSANTGASSSNIKINYRQYLIILQMIFVSQDDMIKRTSDLIEVNINYMQNGSSDTEDKKTTVDCSNYKLVDAYTAVEVSCNVKNNFIFIGGVLDARGSGYDKAADLADDTKDKTYKYTVKREY